MKKNAILFSASNYEKSSLVRADDLPGVKYDIQAMHKRLVQIGFDVKQIENVSKDQIIPALEDNASVMIENAQNISSITIGSAFITDSSVKEQLGKRARNLLGKYVKYDPVCGNQISAVFNF